MARALSKTVWRLVRMGIVAALLPLAVSAQPFDLDTPADSAIWWTLTDEISPQMLRDAYRDPDKNRQRFRDAVAAGLQPPSQEQGLEHVKFYVNSQLTPELQPMWLMFDTWAGIWHPREDPDESARSLASHGISVDGIRTILAIARSHADAVRRLADALGPKQQEFVRMQREILERRGWSEETRQLVKAAAEGHDYQFFVEETGRAKSEVTELVAAGTSDFVADATARTLVELKGQVDAKDWNGLRRLLLDRAVAGVGAALDVLRGRSETSTKGASGWWKASWAIDDNSLREGPPVGRLPEARAARPDAEPSEPRGDQQYGCQ